MNSRILISTLIVFIAAITSNIYSPLRKEWIFRASRKILVYFSAFLGLAFAVYLIYSAVPSNLTLSLNNEIGIIDILLGAISGFLLAYIFESTKKPNIKFELNRRPQYGPKWVFYNLTILNKKQGFPYRSANINQASAWIIYRKVDDTGCEKGIRVRWATTREPIVAEKIDYAGILVPSRESIPIEEESEIPLVFKIKDDLNIYAFNNESYMYLDFTSTQGTIIKETKDEFIKKFCIGGIGKYLIKVRVLADGHEFLKCYKINNYGDGLNNIEIEEIECND